MPRFARMNQPASPKRKRGKEDAMLRADEPPGEPEAQAREEFGSTSSGEPEAQASSAPEEWSLFRPEGAAAGSRGRKPPESTSFQNEPRRGGTSLAMACRSALFADSCGARQSSKSAERQGNPLAFLRIPASDGIAPETLRRHRRWWRCCNGSDAWVFPCGSQ